MLAWNISLGALLIAVPLTLATLAAQAAFGVWEVLPGF